MIVRSFLRGILAAAAVLALAVTVTSPALAQANSKQDRAAPAGESKQVGDWAVRCAPAKTPTPCELSEVFFDKAGARLLGISLAYMPVQDRQIMQISLPCCVALAKGITIHTDAFNTPTLQYHRCDRAGCYVEGLVGNDLIDGLSRSTSDAKVRFTIYGGKTYDLQFSLKGFAEAHNTMMEMAKARREQAQQAIDAAAAQQQQQGAPAP